MLDLFLTDSRLLKKRLCFLQPFMAKYLHAILETSTKTRVIPHG